MSAPPPTDTAIPGTAERAHAALMKHSELQFDFPKFVPPKPPEWLVKLLDFLARILKPVAPYLVYVWWGVVIAAIGLVLFLVIRSFIRRGLFFSWKADRVEPEPEWRPTPETARLLLSDADALAAQGRHAEAIHLILLRSIQEIARHRPAALKPALTSREISALRELPEAARTAFAHIARIVERALFAGREVGQREFAECREAYERFAFPELWSIRTAA
jgi:hypothetical protein